MHTHTHHGRLTVEDCLAIDSARHDATTSVQAMDAIEPGVVPWQRVNLKKAAHNRCVQHRGGAAHRHAVVSTILMVGWPRPNHAPAKQSLDRIRRTFFGGVRYKKIENANLVIATGKEMGCVHTAAPQKNLLGSPMHTVRSALPALSTPKLPKHEGPNYQPNPTLSPAPLTTTPQNYGKKSIGQQTNKQPRPRELRRAGLGGPQQEALAGHHRPNHAPLHLGAAAAPGVRVIDKRRHV